MPDTGKEADMCEALAANLRRTKRLDARLLSALEHWLHCAECADSKEVAKLLATLISQRHHLDNLHVFVAAKA